MFEDGSMVIPGDINFDLEYDFVKIQSTFNATNVESYRTDFLNKIIIGGLQVLEQSYRNSRCILRCI
nr:MAG: hypothetical protein CM15mV30_1650 [uncultured marine virus]